MVLLRAFSHAFNYVFKHQYLLGPPAVGPGTVLSSLSLLHSALSLDQECGVVTIIINVEVQETTTISPPHSFKISPHFLLAFCPK